MSRKTRRRITTEFKAEAVELVLFRCMFEPFIVAAEEPMVALVSTPS